MRLLGVAVLAAACTGRGGDLDELETLVGIALTNNPVLKSVEEGARQADAARDAGNAFLDPVSRAAAGYLSGNAAPPLLATPDGLPAADAWGGAASVEVPIRPGLYAGVGASEYYLLDPPSPSEPGYRTVLGAQIRVPLLQDRGFAQWRERQARLQELKAAAEARLIETRQSIRHAVEQAYIAYLLEIANAATTRSATERAQKLLDEAEALVRLKMVPEYQLSPARLELALRHEEDAAARQAIDAARLRLVQVLGTLPPVPLTADAQTLLARATGLSLPDLAPPEQAVTERGVWRELAALATAAAADTRAARDQLRSELGLALRGAWAEAETDAVEDGTAAEGASSSAAAVLVWTRPWGQTGPKARLREARAREAQLAHQQQDVRIRLVTDLAVARKDFDGAGERLKAITLAVEQARQTLEAEAERFRLGEGRSRNVLDAQNDLTKASRSRNAILAVLLKGDSDFRFAAGYPDADSPRKHATQEGSPPHGLR